MADAILIDYVAAEPPTTKGGTDLCAQQGPLTTSAASSTIIVIANVPAPQGEVFVTFTISGAAARFNFGPNDGNLAAADANSALLPAGTHRFRITSRTSCFRVIQETSAASISWWRSSR